MVPMKASDHWAFLEEIEAPMWIDLTVEIQDNNQYVDDEWFNSSHLFHKCSSHELKSAFSHLGEDITTLVFALEGNSSPRLPASVSRSRGKDFKSEKWRGQAVDFSLDKQQAVKLPSGNSSCLLSGSARKLKTKSSYINSIGTSSSKSSLVCANNATANTVPSCSKISISEDVSSSVSSMRERGGESRTSSTITTDSCHQQQHKCVEVSSQAFGGTSTLLSDMRNSLRKSCVTRQASRVEVNNGRRQSSGHKSSSSKSSVGSSSNPGYVVKSSTSLSKCHQKANLERANVARMTLTAKNKVKSHRIMNKLTIHAEEQSFNSRIMGCYVKSVNPKTVRSKTLAPLRVTEKSSYTASIKPKEKVGFGGTNIIAGIVKENALRTTSSRQKVKSTSSAIGGMVEGQRGIKPSVTKRVDRIGLNCSKVECQKGVKQSVTKTVHQAGLNGPKGRIIGRNGGNLTNETKKIYPR